MDVVAQIAEAVQEIFEQHPKLFQVIWRPNKRARDEDGQQPALDQIFSSMDEALSFARERALMNSREERICSWEVDQAFIFQGLIVGEVDNGIDGDYKTGQWVVCEVCEMDRCWLPIITCYRLPRSHLPEEYTGVEWCRVWVY